MNKVAVLPLFDKLIDLNPEEKEEKSFDKNISLEDLQASIHQDLTFLLNTRFAPLWSEYSTSYVFPYAYGANLTAPAMAETVFEIQDLERKISAAIQQFEPRLKNTKVYIVNTGVDPSKVFVNIDADIFVDGKRTPLTFPVLMDVQ